MRRLSGLIARAAVLTVTVFTTSLTLWAVEGHKHGRGIRQADSNRATEPGAPRKVIIDTDPGVDDAMAILLALNSPELEVEAITVVPGNVTAQWGLENALKLLSLASRCDIPVAGGARRYLSPKLITGEFFHGKNGLGNVELPPPQCKADSRFGPDLIIELVHKYPHQITLVPIGPETNIALAVLKDPSIVPLVREVVMMGGSITGGNTNAVAEANIYYDPEAAQIVFNAGWPMTMVDLAVGEQASMTKHEIEELAKTHGPENDFVVRLLNFRCALSEKNGFPGAPMYDPLAVAVAIDPTLVQTQDMRVDIETRGEFTRGETVANRSNTLERDEWVGDRYMAVGIERVKPNVSVSIGVDAERFRRLFTSRLTGK